MKAGSKIQLAVLVVALVCVSIISMGAQGCGSAIHKADLAAASIGAGLSSAADANHTAIGNGLVTAEEGAKVATLIDKAAKSNDILVADLKTAESAGSVVNTPQIFSDLNMVVQNINSLESEGILGIKNPQAVQTFETIMGGIKVGLATLQVLVTKATSGLQKVPYAPPARQIPPLAWAVVLTPALIDELLAVAAGLVSKLTALKGASDAELQAQAAASDQQAEQQAEADEKVS